jgi:hypothetical protein
MEAKGRLMQAGIYGRSNLHVKLTQPPSASASAFLHIHKPLFGIEKKERRGKRAERNLSPSSERINITTLRRRRAHIPHSPPPSPLPLSRGELEPQSETFVSPSSRKTAQPKFAIITRGYKTRFEICAHL